MNIIWGDFWPRFIARYWSGVAGFMPPYPLPVGLLSQSYLGDAIEEMVKIDNGGTLPLRPWEGTRFQRRMEHLTQEYVDSTASVIPLRYVGAGAYDFVLSDEGIDLFTPSQPEEDFEYYRYYSYRRTGRPCLGVPDYLEESYLTFSVDAPTGPGQVMSESLNLYIAGCLAADLLCLEKEKFVDRSRRWDMRFSWVNYLAVAAASRCWQMEGAVYRGIMTELPRVIAEIWIETKAGFTGSRTYANRFQRGSDPRDIFKERLETALPGRMHCLVEYPGMPTGLTDVSITNQGIFFPQAPAMPTAATMLSDIVQGRAGNPVFTDSRRPDGDE